MREHLTSLPVLRDDGLPEEPQRLTARLAAELETASADELDGSRVLAIEQRLNALAEAIAGRYFLRGHHAQRAERPMGLA